MSGDTIDLATEGRIRRILAEQRAAQAAHPALAERTRAMLAGALACPGLEDGPMAHKDAHISYRVPVEVLERADALVPAFAARPEYQAVRVSRGAVLRLAVVRGLEVLEAETAAATATARKRKGA